MTERVRSYLSNAAIATAAIVLSVLSMAIHLHAIEGGTTDPEREFAGRIPPVPTDPNQPPPPRLV